MKNYKNFLLVALLVFAPFALGAIHPWSIAVCLVLSTVLFAIETIERGVGRHAPSVGVAGYILIGLGLFTLLQLVPLPAALVKVLSPRSAEIQLSLYGSLVPGPPPAFIPLTLDRSSTLLGLMKLAAAVLLFLTVRQRVRKEGSSDVLWCTAWSGVAVALVFFVHRLAGWQRVFELYSPVYAPSSPISAPLLNANHLAGYLGLASAVAVGLAFSETEKIRRLLLIFAAGFTGGGVILTLSRGGILCFIGGQLLFIGLRVVAHFREKKKHGYRELRFLPLALAVGLGSGIYVAYQSVLNEFLYGDASKLQIPADALPLLKDFWLTGVGRGAFQFGYTLVQKLPDGATYTNPENFPAQFLTEWGAIAGGALILLLVGVLVLGLVKPPARGRNAGALVAIFGLLVQNFADFGLEIPGVLLPFMVLLSSHVVTLEHAFGVAHEGHEKEGFTRRHIPGAAGLALAAACLALAALGWFHADRYGLEEDTRHLKNRVVKNEGEKMFQAEAAEAMKRHPADYYFPLLAGIKTFHDESQSPLRYLGRALTLFPGSSTAHLYVARTLMRGGHPDQALLEYMETVRANPAAAGRVAREVVARTGTFEKASGMTRTDDDRRLVYEPLAFAFLGAGLEAEAIEADEALLEIDPFAIGPIERKVRRLIEAGDLVGAGKLIDFIKGEHGLKPLVLELEGEAEGKRGNLETAAAKFIAAWKKDPTKRHLLLKTARIFADMGSKERMVKVLADYEASAPDEISRGYALYDRAALEAQLGMTDKALATYMMASSSIPDEPAVWQSIANLAASKNDTAVQLKAYKELMRLQPDNGEWKEHIEQIQHRLNATLLK